MLKTLGPYLVFPLLMGGALLATAYGVGHGWPVGGVVAGAITVSIIGLTVLERCLPYRDAWNQERGDVGPDVLHMIINQLALPRLVDAAVVGVVAHLALGLQAWLGKTPWPNEWPLLGQLVLSLMLTDLVRYWIHRAAHTVPLLWRFHAVHHCAERLYWLNAGRFHPIDKVINSLPIAVLLGLMGAPAEVMALHFVFSGVHGMFQHCNIDVKLGPLNYVLAMAELHRWHHSRQLEEANANYGNNTIIWDIVFGSFYYPREHSDVADIGLSDGELPRDYLGQLLVPFGLPAERRTRRAREPG